MNIHCHYGCVPYLCYPKSLKLFSNSVFLFKSFKSFQKELVEILAFSAERDVRVFAHLKYAYI